MKIHDFDVEYIESKIDGIFIHLTRKKAIKIPFNSIFDARTKFKPLKDYHIIKFSSFLFLGCERGVMEKTQFGFIYNYIVNNVEWFFYHKKPYLSIKNNVAIVEGNNNVICELKATLVFNILMIIISLIKISMEKLIYAISKRAE